MTRSFAMPDLWALANWLVAGVARNVLAPLGRLIVSPSFHAVHHSRAPEHMDRNFGGAFAIRDHLFGAYAPRGDRPLSYGLIHEDIPECFIRQHWLPLTGIWALIRRKPPAMPVEAAS